ncbi:MAG: alpha/beta hydrolase [Pseudomonadales bacterium]|nr:MAG: alpha/beta hydrolase [Pseudomonadales bacterium]
MTLRFDAEREKDLPEDVQWKHVSGKRYEGEHIRIRGTRPRKVLLYLPGGAFIMRTAVAHRGLVSRLCRGANCKALIVHYRLAPEHPFPGGLEDCLAAYHALLEEGVKPENISIAGDSAGGGLVLSTLLALRDQNSPMPAKAIVLSPLGDLTYTGESRQFNKHRDPMLPNHRASSMHELYIGNASPEDRYISPVLADFDGLPPMLGVVGSTEILLDDTVRAAERAREACVPFNLEIWREMPHVFPIASLLPESEISVERISKYIRSGKLDPLPEKYGWCEPKT